MPDEWQLERIIEGVGLDVLLGGGPQTTRLSGTHSKSPEYRERKVK